MKYPLRYPPHPLAMGLLGLGLLLSCPAAAQIRPLDAAQAQTKVMAPALRPASGADTLLRLYGGLKFGLSASHFAGQTCYGSSTGWDPGALVGLLVFRPLSAYSAVQAEVLFSQKGAHQNHYNYVYHDPTITSTANTYHAALGYIDVPVLAAVGPGAGTRRQGPFAVAGPQLSIALSNREFVRPTADELDDSHEETISTTMRSLAPISLGYVVGVGYRWAKFQDACVALELRYSADFTQVYRSGYGAGSLCPNPSSQLTNGVLQLQASVLFGKPKHSSAAAVPPPPPPASPQPSWPPRPSLPPRPTPPAPPTRIPPVRPPRLPGEGGMPRNPSVVVPSPSTPAPQQEVPVIPRPRQDIPVTPQPRQEVPAMPVPRQEVPVSPAPAPETPPAPLPRPATPPAPTPQP
ncbi:MAG: porin family protein [Janthinobacterium lividum]